jgi:hypothetical protein
MATKQELERLVADPLATEEQRQQARVLLTKLNNTQDPAASDTSLEKVRMDFKQHLLDIRDSRKVVSGMSAQQAAERLQDLSHNWPTLESELGNRGE